MKNKADFIDNYVCTLNCKDCPKKKEHIIFDGLPHYSIVNISCPISSNIKLKNKEEKKQEEHVVDINDLYLF